MCADLLVLDHVKHAYNASMPTKFLPAQDISRIVPRDTFKIRIANMGDRTLLLKNHEVVARACSLVYFVLSADGDV